MISIKDLYLYQGFYIYIIYSSYFLGRIYLAVLEQCWFRVFLYNMEPRTFNVPVNTDMAVPVFYCPLIY